MMYKLIDMKEYYLCQKALDVINYEIDKNIDSFPNLKILEKGVFEVEINMDIKGLKIYKSFSQYLHIKGIFLSNLNDVKYKLSSGELMYSDGTLPKIGYDKFEFNKIYEPYILHTKRDQGNNYIYIEFEKSVFIDKIVIYTRCKDRTTMLRSNCLAVDIVKDDNISVCVYSYNDIIKSYSRYIAEQLKKFAISTYFNADQCYCICYVLISVLNRSYYDLKKFLTICVSRYKLEIEYIIMFINRNLLSKLNKNFCMSYEVCKTFSTYSIQEKCNYLNSILHVINILRTITNNVFFAYGSVLGFIREKDGFIPHDCDMDLIIVGDKNIYPTVSDFLNKIKTILIFNKVKIVREFSSATLHVSYKNSVRFDIFIAMLDKNIIKRQKYRFSYDDILPPIEINIQGFKCPIPKNPFLYLERVYGSNWREPYDTDILKLTSSYDQVDRFLPIFDDLEVLFSKV